MPRSEGQAEVTRAVATCTDGKMTAVARQTGPAHALASPLAVHLETGRGGNPADDRELRHLTVGIAGHAHIACVREQVAVLDVELRDLDRLRDLANVGYGQSPVCLRNPAAPARRYGSALAGVPGASRRGDRPEDIGDAWSGGHDDPVVGIAVCTRRTAMDIEADEDAWIRCLRGDVVEHPRTRAP